MVSQILIYPPLLSPFIFPLAHSTWQSIYQILYISLQSFLQLQKNILISCLYFQITISAGSRILLYRILHYLRTQYSFPKGFTLPSIRIRLSNKRVIFHKNLIIQLNSCRFPSLLFSLQYGQSKPFIQESFKFNFFKKCHRYTFCFQHQKSLFIENSNCGKQQQAMILLNIK
ncbi:unnamed protein product [Paramecium octaurelia]|uniref:Uncharacterized protein n=1 Tax=Paramecium octaurelia TaxID=43137 RepID=A0A8S1YNJ3_PAROT|nr:unnamed protein product [Paramecium octaurelia]